MAKEIKISDELFEKIKSNLEEYGFETVDEYVEFVLNEVLNSDEENNEEVFNEEEEEIIKKRLQDLGYLD
ncbi:CopG family transcriptional regulator [Marinitoga sp. 38H-ov]|uniref:CopG family transcriptional regulator n=1 Tax=Marinitoga sp. 38H-ov TaxID=1755814 RepID=UPI0013EBFC09|nr:CopG family transcriptional regulator [Marinitoga sp. 38H-ov]KAF2956278.1 CopG family transcriptional regulator [Marinitoga sp. 38H-ov]